MKLNKKFFIVLVLSILFVGPFLLARWFFYEHGSQVVSSLGTINHGKLIEPPIALSDVASAKSELKNKWYVLYVIDAEKNIVREQIAQVLVKIKRVRLALGKDFSRVGELFCAARKEKIKKVSFIQLSSMGVERLLTYSDDASEKTYQGIFIMDREQNILMAYPVDIPLQSIYEDLQRLLKYTK